MPQKKIKTQIKSYNDLSKDQKAAKLVINDNAITILGGRAGSGKTHLSTAYALERYALDKSNGGVSKIVITRPTVFRKQDNNGFLPGDINEKYEPWIKPIKDILYDIEGAEKADKMLHDKKIEILPMMFAQGRTLESSMIICDEAENLDYEGVKMLITRLGKNSKMILCGDPAQSLLRDKGNIGINRLIEIRKQVNGLEYVELTSNWRHSIIEDILKLF